MVAPNNVKTVMFHIFLFLGYLWIPYIPDPGRYVGAPPTVKKTTILYIYSRSGDIYWSAIHCKSSDISDTPDPVRSIGAPNTVKL